MNFPDIYRQQFTDTAQQGLTVMHHELRSPNNYHTHGVCIWDPSLPPCPCRRGTQQPKFNGHSSCRCVNSLTPGWFEWNLKLTIIGSDNGLSPGRRKAIIWTNAGILLIQPLGTNFSEISIKIHIFSFKKMHLKMLSGKWQPFVSASMC